MLLKLIQTFEPYGFGAAISRVFIDSANSDRTSISEVERIVRDHLRFGPGRLAKIAATLKINVTEVRNC